MDSPILSLAGPPVVVAPKWRSLYTPALQKAPKVSLGEGDICTLGLVAGFTMGLHESEPVA